MRKRRRDVSGLYHVEGESGTPQPFRFSCRTTLLCCRCRPIVQLWALGRIAQEENHRVGQMLMLQSGLFSLSDLCPSHVASDNLPFCVLLSFFAGVPGAAGAASVVDGLGTGVNAAATAAANTAAAENSTAATSAASTFAVAAPPAATTAAAASAGEAMEIDTVDGGTGTVAGASTGLIDVFQP